MSAQSQEQTKSDNRLAELLDSTLSPSSTASKESNTSNKTTFIGTINATDISNVESPSQSNGSSFLAALDSTTLSPTSADTNVSNTSNETTFIGTIGIETDTSNVGSPMTIESNNFSFSTVDEGQPQDITSKDVNQMVGEENINVNTNTVVRSSYKKADGDTVPLGDNGEKVSKEDDERKTGSLQLLATPAVESKFNRKKDDASADPLNQLCSNQGGDVGVGVDSASSLPSADETVPFNNKVLKSHLSPNGSSSTQNSDDKGDDGQEDNEEEIAQEDSANEGDREGIIANVASLAPTMIPRSECNSEESLETKTDKPKTPNQEIMGLLHRKLPPAKPRFTFLNLAVIVMIASILAVIAIEVSATQCSVFASSFSCVPSFMQSFLILLVWDIIWDNTGRKSGNRVWVWGTFNTLLALFAVTDEINTTMKLPITLFAPTDGAFYNFVRQEIGAACPEALKFDPVTLMVQCLLPEHNHELLSLLSYHIVDGQLTSGDLTTGPLSTLNGEGNVDVVVSDDGVTVNGSNITHLDALVIDGVCTVHVIDQVLIPKNFPKP